MIRCGHCGQWFVPTSARQCGVFIDRAGRCYHVGLRPATADEIAENFGDYPRRDPSPRDTYVCSRCGKAWRRTPIPSVSCTVMHAPGTCCHYGDTEIVDDAALPRCGWG